MRIVLIIAVVLSHFGCDVQKQNPLIYFSHSIFSPENLYQQKGFVESEHWDKVTNLTQKQIGDTTLIQFEVFESAVASTFGNVDIVTDTLFLIVRKEVGISEFILSKYEFKVLNPSVEDYKIVLKFDNSAL